MCVKFPNNQVKNEKKNGFPLSLYNNENNLECLFFFFRLRFYCMKLNGIMDALSTH